jgi:hypothetical protein
MHTTTVRSVQSLGILNDRTPSWRSRLRSILNSRWHRKNEESKHDSLYLLDDRFLAGVGMCGEHRIHNPQNRTDRQQGAPVPAALLAIWMPRI